MDTIHLTAGLAVYGRLLRYAKPYWKIFLLGIVAMMLYASLGPVFAKLIQPLVDGSFVHNDPRFLKMAPSVLVGLSIVRGITSFTSDYCLGWVSRRVITNLRRDLFDQFLNLPSSYYDQSSSGQLLSKLLFNTEQVAESLTKGIIALFKDGMTVIGLTGVMVYENPRLSVVLLFIGPVLGLGIAKVSQRFRKISMRIQESMGNVGHVAQEAIDGQRLIKVFNGKEYETRKFARENESNRQRYMKLIATDAISSAIIQLIYIGGFAAVLYVVSLDSVRNDITPGSLITFVAAMAMLLSPVKRVANVTSILQRGIAAGDSLFEVIDAGREVDTGSIMLEKVIGHIEYKNVSLAYRNGGGNALANIQLTVFPGQTIALVGHSGSGKTSLIRLLPRLYEPSDGTILIDGYPLQDIALDNIRKSIAYVGQEVFLFNDTIANNIAYGNWQREVTTQDIHAAATAAHAMEFIDMLPNGLDTVVGQQGVVLSGGQRQRIAIARALLRNAPILILDEATSALDAESERLIQEALETLMKNRTTLIIAHRLSTIQNANRIYVMRCGRIIEQGTHTELLSISSHYAELYELQFKRPQKVLAHHE